MGGVSLKILVGLVTVLGLKGDETDDYWLETKQITKNLAGLEPLKPWSNSVHDSCKDCQTEQTLYIV